MAKVTNGPSSQPVRCARPGPVCPRVSSLPFSTTEGGGGVVSPAGCLSRVLRCQSCCLGAPLSDWLVGD